MEVPIQRPIYTFCWPKQLFTHSVPVLQDIIPEVITSQKCHTNMGQIPMVTEIWVFKMQHA